MPQLTYLEAIRQGIWEEMASDPTVFCLGEDIGIYGGAFKVTDGFIDRFGPERVIDTPIAESAIVGAAFGAALTGMPQLPSFSLWISSAAPSPDHQHGCQSPLPLGTLPLLLSSAAPAAAMSMRPLSFAKFGNVFRPHSRPESRVPPPVPMTPRD